MSKKKRLDEELRFYEVPHGESVLLLTGPAWTRHYGYFRQHFHNLDEIGFCRDGSGRLEAGEKTWRYKAGTFTCFMHNVAHNTESAEPDQLDTWDYLFFDAGAILEKYGGVSKTQAERFRMLLDGRIWIEDAAEEKTLAWLFDAIRERMTGKPDGFRSREVGYMAAALMMHLASMNPEKNIGTALMNTTEAVNQALSFIDDHFGEEMRIGDLAERCCLSETHFRRLFNEAVNMAPNDYINLVRVQKACDLMRFTDASMMTVAEKTGFHSQVSFNRNFLKVLGTTPYKWKRENEPVRAKHKLKITVRDGW